MLDRLFSEYSEAGTSGQRKRGSKFKWDSRLERGTEKLGGSRLQDMHANHIYVEYAISAGIVIPVFVRGHIYGSAGPNHCL